MMPLRPLLLLLALLSFLPALETQRVVDTTLEQVSLPLLQEARQAAAELQTTLTAGDTDSAQAAYVEAVLAWQRVQPALLGPAANQRLMVAFRPTRAERGLRTLRGVDVANIHGAVQDLGAAYRGLPTIGWLLDGPLDERRRAYASAAAAAVVTDLQAMLATWNDTTAERRLGMVAGTGAVDMATATPQEALDALFNRVLQALGMMIKDHFEKADDSAEPLAELYGVAAVVALLRGIEQTLEAGILPLADQRQPGSATTTRAALQEARAAAAALATHGSLVRARAENPAGWNALFEALRALRVQLKTQVAGALGTAVYFGDSDGD